MKKLYMIGGTMGVGKTTVCQELKKELPNSVFLDGDWCWDSNPFQVNEETKAMVIDNICYLLNNFLRLSSYENVIFCWVMDEQGILDAISKRLKNGNYKAIWISLMGFESTIVRRLSNDIENGIRSSDVIKRSMAKIPLYKKINTIKIDTNNKTPLMIAEEIKAL